MAAGCGLPGRSPHRTPSERDPMSRTTARLARTLTLASVATVAALVGGCSSSTPPAVSTAAESSGAVINVGDQQQYLQTLLTISGALKGAPYKVSFVEFDSGPLVDAGFAAHRIDA